MSKGTKIQWCDDTDNPTSGCDGCELWIPGQGGPCYAGNLHETRLSKSLPMLYDPVFTNVRTIPGRLPKALTRKSLIGVDRPDKPWLNGLKRKIFVGDLGDIFSTGIPFEFLRDEVIRPAIKAPQHELLLLTKQPQRAAEFSGYLAEHNIGWPDNVWIGTSITGRASIPRIAHLRKVPAKIRFLSIEPLVSDLQLFDLATRKNFIDGIRWMIVGGESSQGKYKARRFDPQWAMDVVALGAESQTAVFVKQLGSNCGLELNDRHGGDWDEWPEALRVRQMPFGCQ